MKQISSEKNSQVIDAPISDLDGLVRVVAQFRIANALSITFALAMMLVSATFIANRFWDTPMLDVGGLIALAAFIGFALMLADVATARLAQIIDNLGGVAIAKARINAELEKLTGRDLDKSGAVGDVVMPKPEIKEVVRVIPVRSAAQLKTIEGLPANDVYEFVEQLAVIGLTRAAWLGRRFASGSECNRDFYNAAMEILTRIGAIEGRGRGSDGRLTMTTDEILDALG
jgi:hypothetical protein